MGCLRLNYDYPEKLVQWKVKSGKKVVQVWLSVDPLIGNNPHQSSYVYCLNNPLKYIDPNEMEVIIVGDAADVAFNSLQQGTNLTLSMNKDGKVTATGTIMNDNDQQLFDAINSTNVTVNIATSGSNDVIGQYHGTTYDAKTKTASSLNVVNPYQMASLEKDGAAGSGMMHEVTEGYQMGLIAIDQKSNISAAEKREKNIGNFNYYQPVNSHDYSLFELGHSRATRAPNEMNNRQAAGYKFPQTKYTLPLFERFIPKP